MYLSAINHQQRVMPNKQIPNFGGSKSKVFLLPLGIGTVAFPPIKKLIPVENDTFCSSIPSNEIAPAKNVPELIDLPADSDGWTELHHLCKKGDFEAVKNSYMNIQT